MTTDRQFAGNYDPANVSAILLEARRMRNAILIGFLRRLFVWHSEPRATLTTSGLATAGT